MAVLRVIMIGDVVGDSGLEALEKGLPPLIREKAADFVVVNGENAAGGFGMTGETLNRILAAGADMVTSGNHVWEKREFWDLLGADERVLRPANYPPGAAGSGWRRLEKAGVPWLVVNLQGREMMPATDCPFRAFQALGALDIQGAGPIRELNAVVLVDFHAESTREKEALGYFLDGKASVVAGTHTHVQTADERLLPGGTAYITDLGMTGVSGSVIGMDQKICLDRARNQVLYRMECAAGPGTIQGIYVEIEGESGKALSIERISKKTA